MSTATTTDTGQTTSHQNKLAGFDVRMSQFRQELLDAARELSGQYEQIESEARRRLGTRFNHADDPTTLDGMFDVEVASPPIEPPSGISSSIGPGGTSFVVLALARNARHDRADRDGAGRRCWRSGKGYLVRLTTHGSILFPM